MRAEVYCSYNQIVFVWDEKKRKSNLKKHGLDFRDAHLVYDDPEKVTYRSTQADEPRWLDLALAVIHNKLLALVYAMRDGNIRVISFRPASREERKQYEKDTEQI